MPCRLFTLVVGLYKKLIRKYDYNEIRTGCTRQYLDEDRYKLQKTPSINDLKWMLVTPGYWCNLLSKININLYITVNCQLILTLSLIHI